MTIGKTKKGQIRKGSVFLVFLLSAISLRSQDIIVYEQTADRQSSLDDLNVIYKHDFENNTLGDYNLEEWAKDWPDSYHLERMEEMDIVQDNSDVANPSKALQFNFPVGTMSPWEGGGSWYYKIPNQEELYVSYDLMFMPGFEFNKGGKVPSAMGGTGENPNGRPTDGFAAGLMFGGSGELRFYLYYPDQKLEIGGTSVMWGNNGYLPDYFQPSDIVIEYASGNVTYMGTGQWRNITYRIVLNTINAEGGNYDGFLEAYFDGVLVTQVSHILFRNTADLKIDVMRMYSYFGGGEDTWRTPIDEWLRIDNVMLYTFKDDIDVPRGNKLSPTNRTINYWRKLALINTVAPDSPSSLISTAQTKYSASIGWNDNSSNEYGFKIYRSTSPDDNFTEIYSTTANITSFTNSDLQPGTSYYYQVRAYNDIGYSDYTSVLEVATQNLNLPNAPSSLIGSLTSNSSAAIAWTDNSSNETHFEIERTGPDSNKIRKYKLSANSTNFTDSGLDPNSTYEYKIRACDLSQCSNYAEAVVISIPKPSRVPYEIQSVSVPCKVSDYFYVPIVKTPVDTLKSCIGFDMVMSFNKNLVNPTGRIRIGNDLITDISYAGYYAGIQDTAINISLFLNSSSLLSSSFKGTGQVMAVEFSKTPDCRPGDTAWFKVSSMIESYPSISKASEVKSGTYTTYIDSTFTGLLKFWSDGNPLKSDILTTDSLAVTRIYCANAEGNRDTTRIMKPDSTGNFTFHINNGKFLQIERDIPDETDMMPVINGIDAYMIKKILIQDTTFRPNIYQIIAMDVNMDGKISAGDITQLYKRTMLLEGEYQQTWNYNNLGLSNGNPSKDWLFVSNRTLSLGKYFFGFR